MDKTAIIKALRDTAQSASNTVAENASIPVDAIAWALRKAGAKIDTPVGGSEWMAQKGLTAPVDQGLPKMAGEFLGNVVPAVGFAKAPQIAAGMNRMVDNAMAPTALGKQRGVIDVNAIYSKYPEVDISLLQSPNKKTATLSKLVVPKDQRNSGVGTSVMNDIVQMADEDGTRLLLTPSSDFGGSKSRLKEFYKNFGFVENKGKNKDFETMEAMYRDVK